MEYRNLNRFFVLNKALRLYGKDSGNILRPSDVTVLLAVLYVSGGSGATIVPLYEYLASFHRGFPLDRLTDRLRSFGDLGYVEIKGKHPRVYNLTTAGINILSGIERRCRDTRYDR